MKNIIEITCIKRLSSILTGRLSVIAFKRASGRPVAPTNKQDVREKIKNAKEP